MSVANEGFGVNDENIRFQHITVLLKERIVLTLVICRMVVLFVNLIEFYNVFSVSVSEGKASFTLRAAPAPTVWLSQSKSALVTRSIQKKEKVSLQWVAC